MKKLLFGAVVLQMTLYSLQGLAQYNESPLLKVRIENGRIVSAEKVAVTPPAEQLQDPVQSRADVGLIKDGYDGRIDQEAGNNLNPLLMADLSGAVSVSDGTGPDISYVYQIYNFGNATATDFHVYILLSPNINISPSLDILVDDFTHTLAAMNTYTSSVKQADLRAVETGTYYLGIYVDATNIISEGDETNNSGYDDSPQVVIEALPDLVATDLSLYQIEQNGTKLTFSFNLENRGNISADLHFLWIGGYLSSDLVITHGTDYFYNNKSSFSGITLAPGESYAVNMEMKCYGYGTIIPQGDYYFGIYIDNFHYIAESREYNNTAVDTDPQVHVPAALPDLLWDYVSNYYYASDQIHLDAWIGNYGWNDITDPFSYRLLLSSDQNVDPADYTLDEWTRSDGLDRMESVHRTLDTSTKDAPAGQFYLIWQLDYTNQLTEIFENNNVYIGGPVSLVHLQITSPNGGETCVKGNPYTIQWTSEGNISSVSLALMKAGSIVSVINSSVPNTGTYQYTPPVGLVDGDDYQIKISESSQTRCTDLSDNYFTIQSTAPPTQKPDLVIQAIDVLDGTGPEIRYQTTIKNQGDAAAGESTLKFYLSSDTQINSSDHYIDSWTVSGTLAAGSSKASGERTVTVTGVDEGEYYLGAIADANGQVSESNEGNNSGYDASPKVTIPKGSERFWADLDGDGDVDIVDVQMVAGRWGSQTGDGNYLAICDVDGDGDIDIVDVQMVAGAWGTII